MGMHSLDRLCFSFIALIHIVLDIVLQVFLCL